MIKSISVWAFDPQRSAREIFALAKAHGFEGVELSMGEGGFPLPFQITAQSTPDDAPKVARGSRRSGRAVGFSRRDWAGVTR